MKQKWKDYIFKFLLWSVRDAQSRQYFNLPDAVPSTVSDSSVESLLKGVRSQVEMKEEKVENEEMVRVKEEKHEGEHKIEGVKAAVVLKVEG